MDVRLYLLGAPRVEQEGDRVTFDTRKALALLAYLAVDAERHRREALATLLWPEYEQDRAFANLRRTLWSLKQGIGEASLEIDTEFVALKREHLWLDVDAFRAHLAASDAHEHDDAVGCAECLESLRAAVACYEGDFLSGFTLPDSPLFDEWCFFQAESLRQELAGALARVVQVYRARQQPQAALPQARRWVALDPLHEPAHRALMQLYAQAGRRTAALRQYRECVRILDEELGVAPASETRALSERIQAGELRPERERAAAQTPRHNVPEQLTSFVGRKTELETIAARLRDEDCRLLTLLGPGGIGKTRLAIEAGRRLLDDFSHGVFFASLASLHAPDELVPAIAGAVGFSFYEGDTSPKEQLLRYLRGKEMLLILDNFEHLRDGAELLVEMLQAARTLTLLVTSRERLDLQAEWVLAVEGLLYGGVEAAEGASAVTLFLARSRQAQPHTGDSVDRAAVTEVCRLVDGMPLAIELAAAWTTVLSPEEIAAELADSLDILATTAPDVPARHRSMRAVFDTMWNRLSEPEQRALRQLSVFRGGCERRAAARVADATPSMLMALVRKSALRRDPASGRFELHELLRQYAAEQVAAHEALQERHARYYTTFVQRREAALKGARQQQALAEIETEHDNIRAAWAWAVAAGRSAYLDRAMEGLGRFYLRQMRFQEGVSLCRDAVAHLEDRSEFDTRILAKALAWHGVFTYALGDTEVATRHLEQSLDLLDTLRQTDPETDRLRAFVLLVKGDTVKHSDREAARDVYTHSLTLYQRDDDRWGVAEALRGLGSVAWNVGRFDEAETFLRKSVSISEVIGNDRGLAISLNGLALIAKHRGEFEAAEQMQRRSRAIYRRAGQRWGLIEIEADLAMTLFWQGKLSEARLLLEGALSVYEETGSLRGIAYGRSGLGAVAIHLGEYDAARDFAQDSHVGWQAMDDQRGMGWTYEVLGTVALAEENFADAEELLQRALSMYSGIDQRTFGGKTLAELAYVARAAGAQPEALRYVIEALHIANDIQAVAPLLVALPAAALVFADRDEPIRAVELYALATHRFGLVRNSRWVADVAGRHIEALKETLPPDVVTEAEERGRTSDLWEAVEQLLLSLPQPD